MRFGGGKAPWHYVSVDEVGSGVGELASQRQGDTGDEGETGSANLGPGPSAAGLAVTLDGLRLFSDRD
jgi:hypothetical protein